MYLDVVSRLLSSVAVVFGDRNGDEVGSRARRVSSTATNQISSIRRTASGSQPWVTAQVPVDAHIRAEATGVDAMKASVLCFSVDEGRGCLRVTLSGPMDVNRSRYYTSREGCDRTESACSSQLSIPRLHLRARRVEAVMCGSYYDVSWHVLAV